MIDFEKFFADERFQDHSDSIDISFYFERKEMVAELLEIYTDCLDRLHEKADSLHGKASPSTIERDEFDDDVFGALLHEFLNPGYEPPAGNLAGIQVHLMAMHFFFSFVSPQTMASIPLRQVIQLDTCIIKLARTVMLIVGATPHVIGKANQKVAAGGTRRAKAESNTEAVRAAFEHSGAEWLEGEAKKPIRCEGKLYAINGFATKLLKKYDLPGIDTIVDRLNGMRENRNK